MDAATAGLPDGRLPLWPFRSLQAASAWQAHRRALGGDPQHRLDPAATALEFTRGALGLTGVDRVTAGREDGPEHLVGVGRRLPTGAVLTVATLRLARLGAGAEAPWVVTGTDDAGPSAAAGAAGADGPTRSPLRVDRPAYGATSGSPLPVAGRVTGVDEALRVAVLGTGGMVLGRAGPVVVSGVDQPWELAVPLSPVPSGDLVTVVALVGGHVADVERFALTAVRLA